MKKTMIIVPLMVLFLSMAGCSSNNTAGYGVQMLSTYDGAALYQTTTPQGQGHIKIVALNGSFTEMGQQYGFLMKTELADFYQDVVVTYLMGKLGIPYSELLANARAGYAASMNETQQLMLGVAQTSGLTLDQVEIINASVTAAIFGPGCSAVAAWGQHTGGGPLVLGRNWDMVTGSLDRFKDYMTVVVYNPASGNSVADINYIGQFEVFQSAMNDKGLWIDLQDGSLSSTLTDPTKQSPNKAILEFLMNDSTMSQLDASFMAGPASSSVVMTVADPGVAYSYFWCTQGTYRFTATAEDQSGLLAASNYFVKYPPSWTINPLPADPVAQGYSEIRMNNWLTLANSPAYNGRLNEETMKQMIETMIPEGGGTFPASGYGDMTYYQIVAIPQALRLWIRLPGVFDWEKVDLQGLFR